MSDYRHRIIGTDTVDPSTLVPNHHNWRQHPVYQEAALRESLSRVGWVQPVTVNTRTGRIIDGHLRAVHALAEQERTGTPHLVPVSYVDISEDEEREALLMLDSVAAMAVPDEESVKVLFDEINASENPLPPEVANTILTAIGITLDEEGAEFAEAQHRGHGNKFASRHHSMTEDDDDDAPYVTIEVRVARDYLEMARARLENEIASWDWDAYITE